MSLDIEFVTRSNRPWTSMLANTPTGRRWMGREFPQNLSPSIAFIEPRDVGALASKAEADGLIVQVWTA